MANLPLPRYATAEELEPIRAAALAALQQTVSITWAELKALRDAGSLVPGASYRITDYVATTVAADSRSAGHRFDVIVTADAPGVLNENARAALHEGDLDDDIVTETNGETVRTKYFAESRLAAWRLQYCLDNDTNRFSWADATNGKGVIYRMVDGNNNDVPYDFKSIQVLAYGDTDNVYRYTFDDGAVSGNADTSRDDKPRYVQTQNNTYFVQNNKILPYITYSTYVTQSLNFIVLKGKNERFNVFGRACYRITLDGSAYNSGNYLNTFGPNVTNCTLGGKCFFNMFGPGVGSVRLGSSCQRNFIYASSVSFGNSCLKNVVYSSIAFGDSCSNNMVAPGCSNLVLGVSGSPKSYCNNITIEPGVENVTLSPTGTTSASMYYRNVTVKSGVKGASSSNCKTISDDNVGQTFHTTFKPANSQEVSV